MRNVGRYLCAVVVGLTWIGAPLADAARKPLCRSGLYPVPGDPLVMGGASPDAITLADGSVSIASGCPARNARLKRTRKGTHFRVAWASCAGERRIRLSGNISGDNCDTFGGVFRAKGVKPPRRFTASLFLPGAAGDAFGSSDGDLPPGATGVSPDVFAAFAARPGFHLLGPAQDARDRMADMQRKADDASTVQSFFDANPDLVSRLTIAPDDTDPALASTDGGNFLLTFTDRMGQPQGVITYGNDAMTGLLAGALRRYPMHDNQLDLYDAFYDFYQDNPNVPRAPVDLLPHDQASNFTAADLIDLNGRLASYFDSAITVFTPPGGLPPPGHPASCAAEVSPGDGTDRTGEQSACLTHASGGVYANYFWLRKFYATCVKNQGHRGTCGAFGISAGAEMKWAIQNAQWLNLSEQYLYFLVKGVWAPGPPFYGDGMGIHDVAGRLVAEHDLLPLEPNWDYNPSYQRIANDMTATYTHSCDNYTSDQAPFCSDTNHQGWILCADFGFFKFCAHAAPDPGTAGAHLTNENELWDFANLDLSLGKVIFASGLFGVPVVLGAAVPPSFDNPDANGYVTYVGQHCPVVNNKCQKDVGCECDRGGHIYLISGVVGNDHLPAGAPAGSGGGYLIAKNSWGVCYGDAGYVYLPWDWVKAYAWSAVGIGPVD